MASALSARKDSPTTATWYLTTFIPAVWEEHGETTILTTFRQPTGGVTGKRDRAEGDLWPCANFLSLHERIDPETRKSDPHHTGITELPATFPITYFLRG